MGMKQVFIMHPNREYIALMEGLGFQLCDRVMDADLVVFTGGSDVSPEMYGHPAHPTTHSNYERDAIERQLFQTCRDNMISMLGICRGAQFLNVMNGGTLIQDVEGHLGNHVAISARGSQYNVTSTHHQMMVPTEGAVIEGWAVDVGRRKQVATSKGGFEILTNDPIDPEVVYYEDTNCLCCQFHPEFVGAHESRAWLQVCLELYLDMG